MHRKFFHMHMQIFMGGKCTFPHEPFYLHLRKNFEKIWLILTGLQIFYLSRILVFTTIAFHI